ncbi:type II toxin-antitoxin system HicB family antitoxin [Halolamina litorea]|uniref:Nuclease of the RNAse H fold, HicB family n=1 Tax=Halolamina litorea TaxID=1515593 RepID=A0ABD6BSW7_9EURY|nr:hypothetical protein [Halolamina litorea]
MTESADRPPGVELRRTGDSVIARHEPTGVACHGESVDAALRWLAEGIALDLGCESEIDDPERFIADVSADCR